MLIKNLDGKELAWNPRGKGQLFNTNASSPHSVTRDLLVKKYPTMTILEEVSIPVRSRKTLYFDFYIPMIRTAVEVHGAQHFSFNSHFHKSKKDFFNQKKNDRDKLEWCEINNIELIELRFDEEKDWVNQI